MWIWLLLLNILIFTTASQGRAEETGPPRGAADQAVSTTITAKKMTVKNQDSQAVFEGAVVLTRGSLIVYSDRMVVLFKPQESAEGEDRHSRDATKGAATSKGSDVMPTVSNRALNRIEATGRVKIEKESGTATCEKAVFYQSEEKIVLTGNPVAWDKGTRVSGKQITMFLAEDRSVVEGGSHVRIEPDGGGGK
jgi:lipopolysaccharide export system protein LptA